MSEEPSNAGGPSPQPGAGVGASAGATVKCLTADAGPALPARSVATICRVWGPASGKVAVRPAVHGTAAVPSMMHAYVAAGSEPNTNQGAEPTTASSLGCAITGRSDACVSTVKR